MSSGFSSMTWFTASATRPMSAVSPPRSASTMTMHVRGVISPRGTPNFTARSTTGTTPPRRLKTPRIQGGVRGTRVTTPYSMISRTRRIPRAYSSPATWKLRN